MERLGKVLKQFKILSAQTVEAKIAEKEEKDRKKKERQQHESLVLNQQNPQVSVKKTMQTTLITNSSTALQSSSEK